jgi:hypothetical protein
MKLDISTLDVVRVSSDGIERQYNCPHCDEKRARLWVNMEKRVYHCFNCGIGGKFKKTRMPVGYRVPRPKTRELCKRASRIGYWGDQYLKQHNVDPKLAWKFGVRSAYGRPRLVFPARYSRGGEKITVFQSSHACIEDIHPKSLGYGTKRCAMYGFGAQGAPWTPPMEIYVTGFSS